MNLSRTEIGLQGIDQATEQHHRVRDRTRHRVLHPGEHRQKQAGANRLHGPASTLEGAGRESGKDEQPDDEWESRWRSALDNASPNDMEMGSSKAAQADDNLTPRRIEGPIPA